MVKSVPRPWRVSFEPKLTKPSVQNASGSLLQSPAAADGAAGAATGFVGLFAYLGASLSGWPLARVIDVWHWSGFFAVIAIAAGISALLLLPFLHAQAPREVSEA